jgi:hypothetical protein
LLSGRNVPFTNLISKSRLNRGNGAATTLRSRSAKVKPALVLIEHINAAIERTHRLTIVWVRRDPSRLVFGEQLALGSRYKRA